jgi:hypothetical protein
MKSYGRAPTFLLLTGYEQVRSVVAAIAGDWQSARNVELVLPETGVCSTRPGGEGSACCTPALQVIPLDVAADTSVAGSLPVLQSVGAAVAVQPVGAAVGTRPVGAAVAAQPACCGSTGPCCG